MTKNTKTVLISISLVLLIISNANATGVAQNTTTAPADGSWVFQRYMNLLQPPAQDQWIATLINKNSGIKLGPYAAQEPTTYQVFQIIPNTRTIVSIPRAEECVLPGNIPAAQMNPIQCATSTITEYPNGQISETITRPGCFFYNGYNHPDKTNGTYFRFNKQSGTIQTKTVINGQIQTACNVSVTP